jgi:DNA polymerase theta
VKHDLLTAAGYFSTPGCFVSSPHHHLPASLRKILSMKRGFQEDEGPEPTLFCVDDDVRRRDREDIDTDGSEEVITKGFQCWSFDVRSKKRFYISRTGKVYTGREATKQYRVEKGEEQMRFGSSAWQELQHLMLVLDSKIQHQQQQHAPKTNDELKDLHLYFPRVVVEKYHMKCVTELFDWQVEVLRKRLNSSSNHRNTNLVYSAPTSGGKTLVAEILMLRKLAQRRGTIFFVVPFVALAEQKTVYFQEMWEDLPVRVRSFHADQSLMDLTDDVDVAVCTIEKANVLLNKLFKEKRQQQLSMVVIDEFHMLEDRSRGFLLEVLITKCLHLLVLSCQQQQQVEIVGMSATIPNLDEISSWFGGVYYASEYRPVSLNVKVSCLNSSSGAYKLYAQREEGALEVRKQQQQQHDPTANNGNADDQKPMSSLGQELGVLNQLLQYDSAASAATATATASANGAIKGGAAVALALESFLKDESVIVFGGTKAYVESTAWNVHQAIFSHRHHQQQQQQQQQQLLPITSSGSSQRVVRARAMLLDSLRHTQGGLERTLARTILSGVAYHHAGLMPEQRKLLEDGFSEGLLRVLVATTTLAAGVNLPANRVIIRGMKTGGTPLSVASFRQMCGRAGRMGLGQASGEAVLVVDDVAKNAEERKCLLHLLSSDVESMRSHLHLGRGGGLEKLFLDTIACCSEEEERLRGESGQEIVTNFVKCTLLYQQYPHDAVYSYTEKAVQFLLEHKFIFLMEIQEEKEPQQEQKEGASASKNTVSSQRRRHRRSFQYRVTPLGEAAIASGIPPHEAAQNVQFLELAQEQIYLKGDIHPLFLVTPLSTRLRIKWDKYIDIFTDLCEDIPEVEDVAVNVLKIDRGKLQSFIYHPPVTITTTAASSELESAETRKYKRFYSTIVLLSIVSASPTSVVEKYMDLSASDIYNLQKDASLLCRSTAVFCRELNWPLLTAVLESYTDRLTYGAQEHLLPLMRACGPDIMHSRRAKHFYSNGIESVADLEGCDERELASLIKSEVPFVSRQPLDSSAAGAGAGAATSSTDTNYIIPEQQQQKQGEEQDSHALESCLGLARTIKKKAASYLAEEAQMARLFGGGGAPAGA